MSGDAVDIANYRELFLSGRPMIDARAPVEFIRGSFPGAVNLPLMNDSERQQVGLCYKQQGQQAAIALGHQLVSGSVKSERIQAWADFARANPDGCLYCFRGGLRSQITRQWLKNEAGIDYPRVAGGYKAMRTFLLETIDDTIAQCDLVVLGGMTGTGKTDVLLQLNHALDLEGHANHRGSSFGKRVTDQPSTIDFENRLAIDMLKKRAGGIAQFVLEDESRLVGRCALPLPLYQTMQERPMIWLEDSLAGRVERILRDYVIDLSTEYIAAYGEQGGDLFAEHLLTSLSKLHKRLGGDRHQRLMADMQAALTEQARSGEVDLHRVWISRLLLEYYDPIYDYQRESKASRIEFCGEQEAVVAYLKERSRERSK
ncbi:tRNA 2-selenouridine(34) synthase MnmH [Herbaspirillum sp. RTI4]|uniref:tRNA 2-selenouridine(34) synthase MnmH n=1 Tax=Herbaspirillum sp. RTI4 TaxID=3048640 RepID=UPI002AB58005|nr:tRNA 2-selenouridine(34) synthase MnmH [Herbaspirillum sp. RTI4]MDY7579432.1 tRNA 2-selenouridine(34) synthase MnmH [Herbaspirillum sp. RTI4]MEA9980346.1 tRNA 2-selenouridine(34) synthase MnmH [Herbaspirillum sp. RTI4]